MDAIRVNYTSQALRQGRFTMIPNDLLMDPRLKPGEKMAWACIAAHQWGERTCSWPGVRRIAEMLGVHEETARQYIHGLEAQGFVGITERSGDTNVYELFYMSAHSGEPADTPQITGMGTTPPEKAGPYPPGKDGTLPPRKRRGEENKSQENKHEEEEEGQQTGSAVADRLGKEKSKRAAFRVPVETMTQLVNAYCELKGVKLNGDEYLPVQQAMKSMLMAGHTPEEIIGLMRAFAESTEEWAQSWTFRTVKMKLPEWKAGKLELNGQRCRRDVRDDVTERLEELRRQLRMIDAEISVLTSMHVLSEEEMQRLGELEERREALVQEGLKLRESTTPD